MKIKGTIMFRAAAGLLFGVLFAGFAVGQTYPDKDHWGELVKRSGAKAD